jgi:hypothetical protein
MKASHTRHTHTRQAPDTPTQVSQGNRGQPQTTSAEGQEEAMIELTTWTGQTPE